MRTDDDSARALAANDMRTEDTRMLPNNSVGRMHHMTGKLQGSIVANASVLPQPPIRAFISPDGVINLFIKAQWREFHHISYDCTHAFEVSRQHMSRYIRVSALGISMADAHANQHTG